jgi:metal-responsive CopG/Arc/MetJ family transcriptional regulator
MEDTQELKMITLQETPEMILALDRLARLEGMSRAALIRQLIRAAIREAAEKIAAPQTN